MIKKLGGWEARRLLTVNSLYLMSDGWLQHPSIPASQPHSKLKEPNKLK